MKFTTAMSLSEPSLTKTGFARPDLMILVVFFVILLAVVIPEWLLHGARQGLLAIIRVGGWTAAILGVLFLVVWLLEGGQREGSGWQARLSRGFGHLVRFLISGLIAAILGAGLAGGHGLGSALENRIALATGVLGGLTGCFLGYGLGASRFWVVFRRFCFALLGSFILGVLGLLMPGNWGSGLGILLPLLVFAVLVLSGRIVPRRAAPSPPTPHPPLDTP